MQNKGEGKNAKWEIWVISGMPLSMIIILISWVMVEEMLIRKMDGKEWQILYLDQMSKLFKRY